MYGLEVLVVCPGVTGCPLAVVKPVFGACFCGGGIFRVLSFLWLFTMAFRKGSLAFWWLFTMAFRKGSLAFSRWLFAMALMAFPTGSVAVAMAFRDGFSDGFFSCSCIREVEWFSMAPL